MSTHAPTEPMRTTGAEELSLLTLLTAVFTQFPRIIKCGILLSLTGILAGVLKGRTYTSSATFAPELTSASLSQYAAIAQQFGITLPSSTGDESLDYYVSLLHSRTILEGISYAEYEVPQDGDTLRGELPDLYGVKGKDQNKVRLKVLRLAADLLTIEPNADAGTITVSVTSRWPELSRQILKELLEQMNNFNLHTRQSKARAQREFLQQRTAVARSELDSAEGVMQAFLERNRAYTGSPQLTFEADRLQRRVDLQRQMVTSLSEAYEEARLAEVKSTPIITVIDGSSGPNEEHNPVVVFGALGFILGIGVAVGTVAILEYSRALRVASRSQFEQLEAALRSLFPARRQRS